jgi:soluble lytic murein transglycosylase-like protein
MAFIAVPTLTFAGEVAPAAKIAALEVQSGVSIKTDPSNFSVVSLGRWSAQANQRSVQSAGQVVDQVAAAQTSDPSGYRLKTKNYRRSVYLPHVLAAERQYSLPPGLLDALIWTESRYNPFAVSKAGAAGLGQLMPKTAQALGVSNRYDPRANVSGAARYLRQMLDKFGGIHLAIAAYNAGPASVMAVNDVPNYRETRRYVRDVIAAWSR